MTTIRVKDNEPFDVALRRFKRTIEKLGLLTDLRAREFYEKPTSERKRKKAAAVKRNYKRIRAMQLPKKLLLTCSTDRAVTASCTSSPGTLRRAFFMPNPFTGVRRMSLKDQVIEDMKTAMRAKDSERLGTIRLLLAAAKQKEVDERVVLDDAAMIGIVDKLIKQRKDSVEAYTKAQRMDLADKESAEIVVLQAYLPQRLNVEEVSAAVNAIVASLGAKGPGDMGKVMAAVKAQLAGKADMAMVSQAVKAALAG